MNRWLIVLLAAAALLGPAVDAQAQSHTGQPIVLAAPPAAQPTSPAVAATTAENPKGPIMKILQRRKLGLTVRKITQVLRDMKEEGSLAEFKYVTGDGAIEVDVSSLAVAVIDRIRTENPEGWIDWENIDWDAIIAFVERIIELILKFLPLFL